MKDLPWSDTRSMRHRDGKPLRPKLGQAGSAMVVVDGVRMSARPISSVPVAMRRVRIPYPVPAEEFALTALLPPSTIISRRILILRHPARDPAPCSMTDQSYRLRTGAGTMTACDFTQVVDRTRRFCRAGDRASPAMMRVTGETRPGTPRLRSGSAGLRAPLPSCRPRRRRPEGRWCAAARRSARRSG